MTDKKFILDEHHNLVEVDLMTWAEWFKNNDNRRVALDSVGEWTVSTVFLGIDHNFGDGEPLLYETMIFGGDKSEVFNRYPNWDEAIIGHNAALETLKNEKDTKESSS